MNPITPATDLQTAVRKIETDAPRRCLACSYDLTGLGDSPRCPECGLLNIPQGYRQQVWDLVDSGKWFYSGFFRPFAKRLPGWWWSLDRVRDVGRALRFASTHLLVAAVITFTAAFLANAMAVHLTRTYQSYDSQWTDPVSGDRWGLNLAMVDELGLPPLTETDWTERLGIGLNDLQSDTRRYPSEVFGKHRVVRQKEAAPTMRMFVQPSGFAFAFASLLLVWMLLVWAMPAWVGLYTQLRKGLPEFARAPRTILSAALYECHRLTYIAVFLTFALAVEVGVRSTFSFSLIWSAKYGLTVGGLTIATLLFGAAGWVGPLRSDYTYQLVRSRLHLIRIVAMYALALPFLFIAALASLLHILLER